MAQTAGVKPMTIMGRTALEQERMLGMTPCDRMMRRLWLQDQLLCPNEPVYVEEYWRERINPIRRLYRAPLDMVFNAAGKFLGPERAANYRYLTGKIFLAYFVVLGGVYYMKYNAHDWTKKGGWRLMTTKPMVLPGQEGFPFKSDRSKPQHYADKNFHCSPI